MKPAAIDAQRLRRFAGDLFGENMGMAAAKRAMCSTAGCLKVDAMPKHAPAANNRRASSPAMNLMKK
ncbi:Uncharacterised protein [uncultured archaeon]|nr:Uncharacterised protein [uncultured archaeon]